MNPDGQFRELVIGEKPKPDEIEVTQQLRDYLEQFRPQDRMPIFKGLMSKNKSSQKRAAKKIAKASRQRNRR